MFKSKALRVKDLEAAQKNLEKEDKDSGLVRSLGALDLVSLGIGCIIGTGIFVLTGIAAANYAGPGVFLSFILAGFACALAAFVYSEFASLVPLSGSAYTYVYYTLGELAAWLIGWNLLLEYLVSVSVVAIGWGSYFNNIIKNFGLAIPKEYLASPGTADIPGAVMNVPAAAIIIVLTILALAGIKNSSIFNNIVVAIKLSVVLFFIIFGLFHVKTENWDPFIPERIATTSGEAIDVLHLPFIEFITKFFQGTLGQQSDMIYHYGWQGILTAAGIVFFAYIGFDAVSTVAEECKNPQKDLPIGIIGSLIICTFLYLCVSMVLTGIIPITVNGEPNPLLTGHEAGAALSVAFSELGFNWASNIVAFGALAGMTSIILVMIVAQARILFAMSRDGLLPGFFSKIHPKLRTPHAATIFTGIAATLIASFTPIMVVAELTSIGTLAAFTFVALSVLILRKVSPDLKAKFRAPFMPYTAVGAIVINTLLMLGLPTATWIRFVAWMGLGLFIYFSYGFWFSKMRNPKDPQKPEESKELAAKS